MTVSILNYGLANLRSVQKAFEHVGVEARIISTPEEVEAAERLVVPGVGAVADALRHVRDQHLDGPIRDHVRKDRPLLGICLGLQMLFETCHEDGVHAGLGILKGECVRFDVDKTMGLKVPHMGWNSLDVVNTTKLFDGLEPGAYAYFVHGYHVRPVDLSIVCTMTDYGRPFVSSVRQGNLTATQFHPEKSQAVGLRMLANFAKN